MTSARSLTIEGQKGACISGALLLFSGPMEEPSYLEELIRGGESDCVEFKSERPASDKKHLKTVVAFANGKGGHLLFGIEDGGAECGRGSRG